MIADIKVQLLQQAQAAHNVGNWEIVIQCLQQLVIVDIEQEASQILDLAQTVLIEGDFSQRWDIAKVFPRLGANVGIGIDRAIAPIVEIVKNEEDEELRWYAARILGEFNHPTKAIAALVDLLKSSENDELTSMVASALGQIGNPAVAALKELLAEETTRLIAVQSLSHIRRSEIIAPLLTVVKDPDAKIRKTSIEALGSFHNAEIPPVLLEALDDISAPVRKEAVTGLGFRSDVREELNLVDKLIPRLYDFNLEVCCTAAVSLGRLGGDIATNALKSVLTSPLTPINLQLECIRALGRIETPLSLQYLRSCLNEHSFPVQQEVVKVLGQVQKLKVIAGEILIEALQLSNTLTSAIALSLGRLGELQAIDPLINLLANPDTGVRLHTIAALQQLAPVQAYQQLQHLNNDSKITSELTQGIEFALQEWQQI
ncbi:HEAT repeat domain-containing protein [Chlorogloea sp. CCALA 695]|uniref:HEAT repeat domain-containing protein n=1 Tax=Chlorogloea sp. CCALA 695 TaxID=2107693 RepID=UPI000D049339|nr:HEAT repeat domain-containing protein [Chlorogloea sp. CCALA 695]PSB34031.1 PBS lyase [Chlorogloea sp. CCALA 695]